jgi:hypothetical protein
VRSGDSLVFDIEMDVLSGMFQDALKRVGNENEF